MRNLNEVWIVDAARTPIGKFGGSLSSVRPDDLAALSIAGLVERNDFNLADIEEVVLGCANQAGEDNRNVARMASLLAGLPEHIGATTINRLCGSGLDAVSMAARALMVGDGDFYIAGGVESMTRAPWIVEKPSRAFPTGPTIQHDSSLGWRLVNPKMEELGHTDPLGITAENVAQDSVTREDQDRFALRSHEKAVAAQSAGRFDSELLAVPVTNRSGEHMVEADEGPRSNTSLERLASLRPAFKDGGTVTAGNSSSLNDGAAAVALATADYAQSHGLAPLARIRSMATAGVPPRVMGIGPIPATGKALARADLSIEDMDLIELNEAFAAQALAVIRDWGLEDDDPRVNVNGGAIALGHPLGCSGARILTTLVHELGRRPEARFGLATMCIGVGQGIAMVVEKVDEQ